MTRAISSFRSWARRSGLIFLTGMFLGWLAMAWKPVQGIEIISLSEAEGAQFSDPRVLSIVFHRRQTGPYCSAMAQDFIWLWRDTDGKRVKDRRQLDNAVVPFMDGDDWGIVSLAVPADVDIHDPWFYRRSIREACPVLPSWVPPWFSRWFMSERQFHTEDKPVNFVGAPQASR